MKLSSVLKRAKQLSRPYRVTDGSHFRLKDHDPGDTGPRHVNEKAVASEMLAEGIVALSALQDMLYAQDRWSTLFVFQAMDAAGKDSAIKHVMSGLNPQGCQVASFKTPSAEDLDHDFLWRCERELPERGRIGIFNRSYYEEVLVVKVHPEYLDAQRLPAKPSGDDLWEARYKQIRHFETHLALNGTRTVKFFLHVSRAEQKRRFLERIDEPGKNWKFSTTDVAERRHWKRYMAAYEATIRATASDEAPWYVVPADHKWFTRMVVAAATVDCLGGLDLAYPTISPKQRQDLLAAKRVLLAEK